MPKKRKTRSKPYRHTGTGHWAIQFSLGTTPSGTRKRKVVTARTKAEVEAKADAFEKTHKPFDRTPTGRTVRSYLNEWFESKRADWKPRTQELYRHQINQHIAPALGDIALEDLTPLDVQGMVNRIVKAGSIPTANKCRRLLYSAMKQAARWEILLKNPVEAVDPVREEAPEMKMWTPSETRRFLSVAITHRLFPAFYLMVVSGLRRAEVLGLRWKDLREDGLVVQQTLVLVRNTPTFGTPKTRRSRRFIALDLTTLELLKEHRQQQEVERRACGRGWSDHDLVFPTQIGTPLHPRNFRRVLDTLCRRAGVTGVSLHSLRHLHGSLLIAIGVDAKAISERLGHSSAAFTLERYVHIFDEHRARSAVPLDKLLGDEEKDEEEKE